MSQLTDLQGQYTIPCCIPASLLDSHTSNIIIWSTASDRRNERSVVRPRGYCCQSSEEYNAMNGVSALISRFSSLHASARWSWTVRYPDFVFRGTSRGWPVRVVHPIQERDLKVYPRASRTSICHKSMSAFRTFGDTLARTPSIVHSQWVGPG